MASPQQPHRIQLAGPWEVEWWIGPTLATRQRWRGRAEEAWPIPPDSLPTAITECRWLRRFNRPATWPAHWRVEISLQFLDGSSTVHLNGHLLPPVASDAEPFSRAHPCADSAMVGRWRSGELGDRLVVGANELRLTHPGPHPPASWWRGVQLEVWGDPTFS